MSNITQYFICHCNDENIDDNDIDHILKSRFWRSLQWKYHHWNDDIFISESPNTSLSHEVLVAYSKYFRENWWCYSQTLWYDEDIMRNLTSMGTGCSLQDSNCWLPRNFCLCSQHPTVPIHQQWQGSQSVSVSDNEWPFMLVLSPQGCLCLLPG